MNARDAMITGDPRLHRMIRHGTNYGPSLPPGVLEDDGADRGLMFALVGARLDRQFEFVQRKWINDGKFLAPRRARPTGRRAGRRAVQRPAPPDPPPHDGRRRFVVNRGGEYCFMPGLRALRWLADLEN
jgi:hypothetical protein